MKRKIFSKLLMVALVIAAVGSFVSCKDYDDDINNLQKQIDNAALKSSVEALQSTLEGKIATAQSAAQAAQTAADKAAATANAAVTKAQLDDAISAAKTAAATAANEYADKVATAAQTAAAQQAYDDAKAYVDAEVAKVTAAIPSEDAIKAIADASAAALDDALATELKAWVNEQIDAIDVQGAVDAAVADAISKMETATANVNAIWSAVTEVELVVGVGNGITIPGQVQAYNLRFLTGVEIDNVFGSTTKGGNAAMPYGGATEEKTYVAGDSIKFDNRVVVRVSPVNATFKAEDVVLQNSLGETLNDLVNISVEPYKQLITRGNVETGLWTINFVRKAEAKNDDFATPAHGQKVNSDNPVRNGTAAFAVAINNSKDASTARYAVSEYGLDIYYGAYYAAHTFQFDVQDKNGNQAINSLHNRWNPNNIGKWDGTSQNRLIGEDETREAVKAGKWNAELAWKDLDPRPATEAFVVDKDTVTISGTAIYEWGTEDNNEGRYGQQKYVELSKTNRVFTIKSVRGDDDLVTDANKIQYYYVVLDRYAAVESAPSEYESWASYTITGLNKIVPATDNLTIEIESEEAVGDIIGFRVFAVNYDGTLADPDGRSFYVKVGDPNEIASNLVAVTFTATNANGTITQAGIQNNIKTELVDGILSGDYNFGIASFDAKALGLDLSVEMNAGYGVGSIDGDVYAGWATAANDLDATGSKDINYAWAILDKDYKATTTLSKAKYIAVAVKEAGLFGDNSTIYLSDGIFGYDEAHHNVKTNKITIALSKTFPTTPIGFSWKPTYAPEDGVKTFYVVPTTVIANQWIDINAGAAWADWVTNPAKGFRTDMTNFALYSLGDATQFTWKFWETSVSNRNDGNTIATVSDDAQYGLTPNVMGTNSYLRVGSKRPGSTVSATPKTVYGQYGRVYDDISCPADMYGDYLESSISPKTVNAFAGNVVFEDALTLNTYTVNDYTYYTKNDKKTTTTSKLYAVCYDNLKQGQYNFGYNAAGAAVDPSYVAAGAAGSIDLFKMIKQSNAAISVLNNVALDGANWVGATAKVGDGSLLTATVAFVAATSGYVTFAKAAGSSTPLSDVKQNLTVTLTDIFGNKSVVTMPIMIIPTAKTEAGWME